MFPFSLPFSFDDFFVAAPHPGAGGDVGAAALAVASRCCRVHWSFLPTVCSDFRQRGARRKKRRLVLLDFNVFVCFSDLIILQNGECVSG